MSAFRVAENVSCETLDNGLTVLIKENHNAPVTALLASVRAGYFDEPDRVNGIAHVIEHMLFKGTPSRPGNEQIAEEIRALGGYINAATYYEETYYYIVVPSQHTERAMDILADAVQNSLFDAEELAKEIEVIVQESLQKRDNPNAMLVESLYALAFDQHRIRRWRIGEPETLRAMSHDDLAAFVEQYYRGKNVTVTLVGDIQTEEASRLVRKYWSGLAGGDLERDSSPSESSRDAFRFRRILGDTRQRLLLFSLPAPPILHPDTPALLILNALLSDGRSARLFQKLKEELRIANSAWAGYEGFRDFGLFTLGAECIGDDPLPVEQALWGEMERVKTEHVSAEELDRIKTRVQSRRLFAQEEVLGVARSLTTYQALGDYRLTDVMLERLQAVTVEDVQRVANQYLKLDQAALCEYLPMDSKAPDALPTTALRSAIEAGKSEQAALPTLASLNTGTEPGSPRVFSIIASEDSDSALPEAIPLPGGGTLIFKARRDLPIVALNILFRGGKRHETRSISGITNLMVKSSLKGTPSFSAEQIANRVEALGSGIGASLAADYLGYGLKIKREALSEAFGVLGEVITSPTFPNTEVDREKQAISAEIRRQQDNNFGVAYDLFTSACYGSHHPYGLPANGVESSVASLTRADLLDWHSHHVSADNLYAAIVGDISREEAVAMLSEMEALCPRTTVGFPPFPHRLEPFGQQMSLRQKKQTAAVIGWAGVTVYDEDRYALDMLAEITSGMGGRFFRAVRGDNALAYQVTSFHRSRRDAGNFIAYTSTAPENEEKARNLLLAECARLSEELVEAEELQAAKAAILGEHVIGTQTFGAQAGELAGTLVYDLPLDEPQRYLERMQRVTAEEVRAAAQHYLQPERCWMGIAKGGERTMGIDT